MTTITIHDATSVEFFERWIDSPLPSPGFYLADLQLGTTRVSMISDKKVTIEGYDLSAVIREGLAVLEARAQEEADYEAGVHPQGQPECSCAARGTNCGACS